MDIENKLKITKGEREWRRDKNGSLGLADTNYCIYIYIYKRDKQQRPTLQHRELYPMSCDKPK